jgi:hypothetical protein
MNSKIFTVIFLFLVWSFGSGWYYVCKIKGKCSHDTEVDSSNNSSGISFRYGEAKPNIDSDFDAFKSAMMLKLDSSNRMKITGLYSPSEVNSTGFENLGVARAIAIQNLFSGLDQRRFDITSREEGLDASKTEIDAIEFEVFMNNAFVEEKEYGAILHPDFNGDSLNSKITAYLTYVALEKKSSRIDIVGHTSNSNPEGENFNDGLNQANRIMDFLIEKGMIAENLNPSSKGETEPIAGNDSEEGRVRNNRVELLIN